MVVLSGWVMVSLMGNPWLRRWFWCGGGDLNPHALRRQILSLVRLPISPPPHWGRIGLSGGHLIVSRLIPAGAGADDALPGYFDPGGSSGRSHAGTGCRRLTILPASQTAARRYGAARSSLSKTRTCGSSRNAARRLVRMRGYRAISFSVGTSWPP